MTDIETIFSHPPFLNDQQKVLAGVVYLAAQVKKHMQKSLDPYDLSINQYRALRGLRKIYPAGMAVYKLRTFIVENDADVSRLVSKLEKRGLVSRQATADKKSVSLVVITPEGVELMEKADNQIEGFLQPAMFLNSEKRSQLSNVVCELVDAFARAGYAEPDSI